MSTRQPLSITTSQSSNSSPRQNQPWLEIVCRQLEFLVWSWRLLRPEWSPHLVPRPLIQCCVVSQVAQLDYVYTFAVCSTTKPPANCLAADGTSRVDPYWAPAWQTNGTETAVIRLFVSRPTLCEDHFNMGLILGGDGRSQFRTWRTGCVAISEETAGDI